MRRTQDEVAIHIGRSIRAIRQLLRLNIPGRVWIARRWSGSGLSISQRSYQKDNGSNTNHRHPLILTQCP